MRKHLLFYLVLLSFSYTSFAQLAAGDIALIGYNTDSPEGFSFITLTDIPANEVIFFTEQGWNDTNNIWMANEEPHLQYTPPIGGLNCGTIINITETNTDTFTVTGGGGITIANNSNFNLINGDQILAYQAATVRPANAAAITFITALNGDFSINSDGWNAGQANTSTSSTQSALPPGLTNGTNAIGLFPNQATERDNARYNGTLTGTADAVRMAINNRDNWSFDTTNSTVFDISPTYYQTNIGVNITCAVADTTPPMITCPADIITGNETDVCGNGTLDIGMATATDAVGVTSITNNAPMTFPIGSTMVTWTAMDAAGNMATCIQTVTINDTQLPTISCLASFTVQADAGENFATGVNLGNPITADNCGVASITNNAPMTFPLGTTTVTWTVTDTAGNMATCDQMVTVNLCNGITVIHIGGGTWIPTPPSSNDVALLLADYDTSIHGSLSACSIIVDPGLTLNVGPETFVQTVTDIIVNGTLNVEPTGSVVQLNNSASTTNNGAISVNVTTPMLETRDFMILGSPMSGESREDVWSSAYNVQFYNTASFVPNTDVAATGVVHNFSSQNTNDWNLLNTGTLMAGEGYLVFPQDSFNGAGGIFNYDYNTGTFNNGIITRPLTFNTAAENSPNMLSNPYPSGFDADLFLAANAQIDALYFWEHLTAPNTSTPGPYTNNYNMDDISVYNAMGGIAAANGGTAPTGIVATAQGFGVFASAAGTATFNNSMRVTTGNNTLRTNQLNRNRLWLNITSETYGVGSNALVGFTSNATAGYDASYDSPRLATIVSLYSNIEGDLENGYAIQGREAFNKDIQIPFSFSTDIDELTAYRISLSDFDGAAWDTNEVLLVDHNTGITTNLSKTTYIFTSEMGTFNGRFTIQFKDNTLTTNDIQLSNITFYPNPTTGLLNIVAPNTIISGITVTDIQGRIIENIVTTTTNNYKLEMTNLESAVYFITVTTNKGTITKRILRK